MITPNQKLQLIKQEMTAKGWTAGGGPGAVKYNRAGLPIAAMGEKDWETDIHEAISTVEAQEAFQELKRRHGPELQGLDVGPSGSPKPEPFVHPFNSGVPG